MDDFDVVIIGSGCGGLAAGLTLAQNNKKVGIFEQHSVEGGNIHSFRMHGRWFSPGLHYIGELSPGSRMHRAYSDMGIMNRVGFNSLPQNGLDEIDAGGWRFVLPAGLEPRVQALAELAPSEESGIRKLLRHCKLLYDNYEDIGYASRSRLSMAAHPLKFLPLLRDGSRTWSQIVSRYIGDQKVIQALAAQCIDSGLPANMVSGVAQAVVTSHFLDGAWYPVGGARSLVAAFVERIEDNDGIINKGKRVEEILIEERPTRAVGIRLENGKTISAKNVVCNADPRVLATKLLPYRWRTNPDFRKMATAPLSSGVVSFFIILDCDPREYGLSSGNRIWYAESDIASCLERSRNAATIQDRYFRQLFISSDSLKDPGNGPHAISIFTLLPWSAVAKFAGGRPNVRQPEYRDFKKSLIDQLRRSLDVAVPGICKHIQHVNCGTPLTSAYYCAASEGNLYGLEKTVSGTGYGACRIRSSIRNLWCCGASTAGHGVSGSTLSGISAANLLLES